MEATGIDLEDTRTYSATKPFALRRPHLPGRVSYASESGRRKSSALKQPRARAGVGAYASITDVVGLRASHAISLGVEQKAHFPLWPRRENQGTQANDKSVGAAGIYEGSVYPISVNHRAGPLWPGITKSLSAEEGRGHRGDSCRQRAWQLESWCWTNACRLLVAESPL